MIKYINASEATLPSSGGATKSSVDGTNFSWTELLYDDTAEEKSFFQYQIPDNYDGGNVVVRVFWKAAATAGSVVFAVSHRAVGDDGIWDAAGSEVLFAADAAKGTTEDLNVASKTLTTPWTAGKLIQIALPRKTGDAGDDMVGDGKVLGLSLEFGLA